MIARNVTRRKRAEAELLKSNECFRLGIEAVGGSVYIWDLGDGTILREGHTRLFGYRPEEIEATHDWFLDRVHPDDRERARKDAYECIERGGAFEAEYRFRARDGSYRNVLSRGRVIRDAAGRPLRMVGGMVDITERKRAEEALKESEERYRGLFENANDLICTVDLDWNFLSMNRVWERELGYAPAELIGRNARLLLTGDSLERACHNFEAKLQGKAEKTTYELDLVAKDGQIVTVEVSSHLIEKNGKPMGVQAIARNITERKRAEEHLAYQAHLLASVNDAVIALDENLVITSWNQSAEAIYGWKAEEVVGRSAPEVLQTQFEGVDREEMFRHIVEEGGFRGDVLEKTKDGRTIVIDAAVMALPAKDNRPAGYVSVNREITERKRLEEQLVQAQKMEAVGRLAGGIAHDFNNMLTAITGYSELTLAKLEGDSPVREGIEEVVRAAEQASALTGQLLAFSRRQMLRPIVLDLNEAVVETNGMLRPLIGEDVELVFDLARTPCLVEADRSQIQQVILNLAVNARGAMPEGGRLTIATQAITLATERQEEGDVLPPGRYALLAVSDTGQGMDAVTKTHLFEPFFTTKAAGEGTGLGLATVYGIVKQSRGYIAVESEPGRGATFHIYLPCAEEVVERPDGGGDPSVRLQGEETVLLVEDEELVRRLVRAVLIQRGYSVLEAASGEAALELARVFAGRIDLLLTDAVMPGMSGRELAEKLGRLRPDLRVLYTSGYTDDAVMRRGIATDQTAFLPKPFTPDALASKVREVLAA